MKAKPSVVGSWRLLDMLAEYHGLNTVPREWIDYMVLVGKLESPIRPAECCKP